MISSRFLSLFSTRHFFVFFFLMIRPPPGSPLFPYTTLFRSGASRHEVIDAVAAHLTDSEVPEFDFNFATVYLLDQRDDGATLVRMAAGAATAAAIELGSDRKSTRLNSSHSQISYAVFCLKKK